MTALELAADIKSHTKNDDLTQIKKILGNIHDKDTLIDIENAFRETDPVNFAIDNEREDIAMYLVELGFNTKKRYNYPDRFCDQWCYFEHDTGPCPAEYDAETNAADKGFKKLTDLIRAINNGQRLPGESLHTISEKTPRPPPKADKPANKRPLPSVTKKEKTNADRARDLLKERGPNYVTKHGSTLLHDAIHKLPVYVYILANEGVPVNIQNYNGDTALHLAVRNNKCAVAESLLQCGADPFIRNNMGQTACDEAPNNKCRDLIQRFEPGAVNAVLTGKSQILDRLVQKMWIGMNTIVKEGRTLIQLAELKIKENENVKNCLRILKEHKAFSDLIHAVLCESEYKVKEILNKQKGWNVNSRFRDNHGTTLLSHAIDSNNEAIVKLLVDHGAKVNRIRVRSQEEDNETIPIFHKCVQTGINSNIATALYQVQGGREMQEKDRDGYTALHRAITNDVDSNFIKWLIKSSGGQCLLERTKNGKLPIDLATENERWDVVKIIHRFVLSQLGKFYMVSLPVHFYGEDHTNSIKNESTDKYLPDLVTQADDVKSICQYKQIEEQGIMLFNAAANGKLEVVKKLNEAAFKDQNGYTALTRAIVFNQLDVARHLCTSKPALKLIPDNSNRYPLHYAFAMPENQGQPFVKLLLEKDPESMECRVDKDGRFPAEYKELRETDEIQQMLYDARTCDHYRKRVEPLGPWPEGANKEMPS